MTKRTSCRRATFRARVLSVILVLMTVFSPPAQAVQFSGAYLLHVCRTDSKGNELVPGGKVACQAYIMGVIDYHSLYAATRTTSLEFCLPPEIGPNGLQIIVTSYLARTLPLHAKFTAAPAVAMALYEAFPCGGKRR